MRKSDEIAKIIMYFFNTSIKNKHVGAFLRYGSLKKLVNLLKQEFAKACGVDGVLVRAAVAPGNTKNRKKYYTWNDEKGFCRRFWYTASVNADLGLTPCCNYFYKSDDMGSLKKHSFFVTTQPDFRSMDWTCIPELLYP